MSLSRYAKQLQDTGYIKPQRVCIYGASGSGKTALAAQLAKQFKLHWIDIEDGMDTLFNPEVLNSKHWDNIELYKITDAPETAQGVRAVFDMFSDNTNYPVCYEHSIKQCPVCRQKCKHGKATCKLCPTDSFYPESHFRIWNWKKFTTKDVIVLDSATQLMYSAIQEAVKKYGQIDYKKKEFDHYGHQGQIIETILQRMKRMPCHVVMIAHEIQIESLGKEKLLYPVFGTKPKSREAAKDFGHIIYTSRKNNKHIITSDTTSNSKINSKSRTGVKVVTGDDICKCLTTYCLDAAVDAPVKVEFDGSKENFEDDIDTGEDIDE